MTIQYGLNQDSGGLWSSWVVGGDVLAESVLFEDAVSAVTRHAYPLGKAIVPGEVDAVIVEDPGPPAPRPVEHVLRMGRVLLGSSMAGGRQYGTYGHCDGCDWRGRSNEAPSKGGNKAVDAQFQRYHREAGIDLDGTV